MYRSQQIITSNIAWNIICSTRAIIANKDKIFVLGLIDQMISKMNIEKLKNDKTNLFLDLEMPKDSCLGSLKKAYEKEDKIAYKGF